MEIKPETVKKTAYPVIAATAAALALSSCETIEDAFADFLILTNQRTMGQAPGGVFVDSPEAPRATETK